MNLKVKLKDKGTSFTLAQSDYIAGGGEGKVFKKGGYAFKIYHDPVNKMLPIGKLIELTKIKSPNVLGPKDILLSSNDQVIGFVMDYVSDTVFICWLFNKGYKDQNNIKTDTLTTLIKSMKSSTTILHADNFVVGDYNEMNFLADKDLKEVLFIDVDSYQTPHYPCTAIMDTVRDRTVPFGTFSKSTDWFGYAVVTFQLWTGIHPYKGKHPDYSRQDVKALKLMDDNISIFNKKVTLPENAISLDVIPTVLKRWYQGVFENKDRSIPPDPGDVAPVLVSKTRVINSHGNFTVEKLFSFESNIQRIRLINGRLYTITKNSIFWDDKLVCRLSNNYHYDVCEPNGSYDPVIVKGNKGLINFFFPNGTDLGSTEAEGIFVSNNNCYTIHGHNVVRHCFVKRFDKFIHQEEVVETVSASHSLIFDGVIVQDLMGNCFLAMPYNNSYSKKLNINELDGHRFIDAKFVYDKTTPVFVSITEHKGKYHRTTILFTPTMNVVSITQEDTNLNERANFIVVPASGVCAMIIEDHTLRLVKSGGIKNIDNPPFDSSIPLFTDGFKVLIANNKELLKISLK